MTARSLVNLVLCFALVLTAISLIFRKAHDGALSQRAQ